MAPPVHLRHEGPAQGRPAVAGDPRRHLAVVLPRRQDRRPRRQRRGQVVAAAHHGRRRPGLSGRGVGGTRARASATCRRSRSSIRRKTCSGNVELAVEGAARAARRVQRDLDEVRRADGRRRDGRSCSTQQAKVQEQIDAHDLWNLDNKIEIAMDALRLPPADADVTQALRRREAPRRAVPGAARGAGHAAARRADEPPRRRERRVARALPRTSFPGTVVAVTHDRYFLDNVAEAGSSSSIAARASRTRATTRAGSSRSSTRLAQSRRRRSRRASARWSASSSGCAWRRARGRRRARRASRSTRSWPSRTRSREGRCRTRS